ncbi:hypothetical protein RF11_09876 [Thelohanellus kitauei]|uniref:Reverse transcriptase/retrotransposon-derived protein RNase H-like domain-containing protein n=1 Tax=Thelohanellus kitauei TaxID=669202 RepID=A0A0C2MZZ9_THEKT|nr:hypothetical protein RF11_09876 [Thelohanellus kitauei]
MFECVTQIVSKIALIAPFEEFNASMESFSSYYSKFKTCKLLSWIGSEAFTLLGKIRPGFEHECSYEESGVQYVSSKDRLNLKGMHRRVEIYPETMQIQITAIKAHKLDLNSIFEFTVIVYMPTGRTIEEVTTKYFRLFDKSRYGKSINYSAKLYFRKNAAEIFERIETSDWAFPIVVVHMANVDIRICADFRVCFNSELQGINIYLKLDRSQAYFQILLDEESKQNVAASVRNKLSDCYIPEILQNFIGRFSQLRVFLHDKIVTDSALSSKVRNYDVFKSEVIYIGQVLYRTRGFNSHCGIMDDQQKAFHKIEHQLIETTNLTKFDPTLPSMLRTDASSIGFGTFRLYSGIILRRTIAYEDDILDLNRAFITTAIFKKWFEHVNVFDKCEGTEQGIHLIEKVDSPFRESRYRLRSHLKDFMWFILVY